MFRRVEASLPKDPYFPDNFEKLGFFIDENDQIRNIEHPEDFFRYWVTKDQRTNDTHREAMHACIRREVFLRLNKLNVHPLYLPDLTDSQPTNSPHLTILATPRETLRSKKRVIVIMNRVLEDLAVWAYRILSKEGGLNEGSVVAFVQEVIARAEALGEETPGVVILNPGQLLYSWKHNKSMTPVSWDAMPRKSAVHPAPQIHPVHNHVPGNETVPEHIDSVFKNILSSADFVAKDAEIFLVGLGDGGEELVKYLETNWNTIKSKPTALALTAAIPIQFETSSVAIAGEKVNPAFLEFLAKRARAWQLSHHPLNTPLANATLVAGNQDEIALCPHVSSGEEYYAECVMPKAYKAILDWFGEVVKGGGERYENPVLDIPDAVLQEILADLVARDERLDWAQGGEGENGSEVDSATQADQGAQVESS